MSLLIAKEQHQGRGFESFPRYSFPLFRTPDYDFLRFCTLDAGAQASAPERRNALVLGRHVRNSLIGRECQAGRYGCYHNSNCNPGTNDLDRDSRKSRPGPLPEEGFGQRPRGDRREAPIGCLSAAPSLSCNLKRSRMTQIVLWRTELTLTRKIDSLSSRLGLVSQQTSYV